LAGQADAGDRARIDARLGNHLADGLLGGRPPKIGILLGPQSLSIRSAFVAVVEVSMPRR
jgi:hypothetical protein